MNLNLVVAKGEPKGKAIAVTKDHTLIGRKPECDVVIASTKVSREHCRIDVSGNQATLVDLGSGNGTLVNGHKVDKAPLRPGDRLVIGPLGLVVEIDGNRGAAAADGAEDGDIHDFLASLESGGQLQVDDEDLLDDKGKK